MDAAIVGLVGLGGLYTIANQEKKAEAVKANKSQPKSDDMQTSLIQTKEQSNYYPTSKQATQKYRAQDEFKKKVRFDIPEPPKRDFTHNNMVPFFGAKIHR
jgi:hypothetical protein